MRSGRRGHAKRAEFFFHEFDGMFCFFYGFCDFVGLLDPCFYDRFSVGF